MNIALHIKFKGRITTIFRQFGIATNQMIYALFRRSIAVSRRPTSNVIPYFIIKSDRCWLLAISIIIAKLVKPNFVEESL